MNNACIFQEVNLDMWIDYLKTVKTKIVPFFSNDVNYRSYNTVIRRFLLPICIIELLKSGASAVTSDFVYEFCNFTYALNASIQLCVF